MKSATCILVAFLLSCRWMSAQVGALTRSDSSYDSSLAKRVGADEYGMKRYVMAFLKAGTVTIRDSVQREEIQRKHLHNIKRLAAEGTLLLAGPFLDRQSLRGIFLFNVATVEEASTLAETDPAVQAGVLVFELHPPYGTAALMEIPRIHKTIERKSVAD